MTLTHPTTLPTARAREVSNSIASGRAVTQRCEARLDVSRMQVLRADALVRRVRVYLEGYDERRDGAALRVLAVSGVRRPR